MNKKVAQKYHSGNIILKETQLEGALVLGDCNSALDKKIQKSHKIQTIISIGQEALPPKQKISQNCLHKFYDIHDNKSQKIPPQLFDEVCDLIQIGRKKGGVLVHCYAGVSRSSSFVIAYVMRKYLYDFDKSKQLVKKHRSCIHPGDGFIHQLKHYWKVLQKRQQQRLKQLERLNKKDQQEQTTLSPSKRRGLRGAVKIADVPPQKVKQIQSKNINKIFSQAKQDIIQQEVENKINKQVEREQNTVQIQQIQQKKFEAQTQILVKDKSSLKKQKSEQKIKRQVKVKKTSVSQLQKTNASKVKILPKKVQVRQVIVTDKKIISKKVQQKKQTHQPKTMQTGKVNSDINLKPNVNKQVQISLKDQKVQEKYQKTKNIYTTKTKVL